MKRKGLGLQRWIAGHMAATRAHVAAGDSRMVNRRYLPAALLTGLCVGALLAFLSALAAVCLFVAAGFALGYAARSYVSYRRRMKFLAERELR